MSIPIEVGTRVTLNFALTLEDGEVVDSNFDAPPASFTIGDGNLLPGFEAPLVGLKSGDENEFLIAPEKAFGQHNPQNVQAIERDNFSDDELDIGLVLSFQNGDGELPGRGSGGVGRRGHSRLQSSIGRPEDFISREDF